MRIDKKTFQLMKKIPNSGYDDIKVKFLYHSNRIEGSVLSERALSSLIWNGVIDRKQEEGVLTLNDLNESLNSGYLFDWIIDTLDTSITKESLCEWHRILMKNTSWEKEGLSGKYKLIPNTIRGANIEVATIDDVEPLMQELLEEMNAKKETLTVSEIAYFHARFEHIHPFQDGNGRIGRFIILKQCIQNNIPLIAMTDDFKNRYYQSLELAQVSKYYKPLTELFEDCEKELDCSLSKLTSIVEQYRALATKEAD